MASEEDPGCQLDQLTPIGEAKCQVTEAKAEVQVHRQKFSIIPFVGLCEENDHVSSFLQGLVIEELSRYLDGLTQNADRFDAECDLIFDMHRSPSTNAVSSDCLVNLANRVADRLGCQDPNIRNQFVPLMHKLVSRQKLTTVDSFLSDELNDEVGKDLPMNTYPSVAEGSNRASSNNVQGTVAEGLSLALSKDVPDEPSQLMQVCAAPGCCRHSCNDKAGEHLCRTCAKSGASKHGPDCALKHRILYSDMPAECSIASCQRDAWNGGHQCCRTCKRSHGARHSTNCDARFLSKLSSKRFNKDDLQNYLITVLALLQRNFRTLASGEATVQPVRLRMVSADKLCARSMEVEWSYNSEVKHTWSSWDDQVQNGWYEAEKILPSSATDIKVYFKVRTMAGILEAKNVKKVDRKNGCKWVHDSEDNTEVFWLRVGEQRASIDAVFQLKRAGSFCHVARAWNAARIGPPENWEQWDSRPQLACPLATIQAADRIAPARGSVDPLRNLEISQARLKAAAGKLVEIRRETIKGLRKLDENVSAQWFGVNTANTGTAGLAMGSALAMFVAPPLGVGLGVVAAASGSATAAADIAQDSCSFERFRAQLSLDTWNTMAVAELENEYLLACEKAGEALGNKGAIDGDKSDEIGMHASRLMHVGSVFGQVGVEVAGGSLSATSSSALQVGTRVGSVAARAFAVVGAVAAAGVAVHGWCSMKHPQKVVRAKLKEMTASLLFMQRWLAGIEHLECPICLEVMSSTDEVQRCKENWHYFHSECLNAWCQECDSKAMETTCPECRGEIALETDVLDEFITSDMRNHLAMEQSESVI